MLTISRSYRRRRLSGSRITADQVTAVQSKSDSLDSERRLPDRWWLYVPRNLSDCGLSCEEVAKHIRFKTGLLNRYLIKHHPHLLIPPYVNSQLNVCKEEQETLGFVENENCVSPSEEKPSFFLPSPCTSFDEDQEIGDHLGDYIPSQIYGEPFLIDGEPKWNRAKQLLKRPRSKSCISQSDLKKLPSGVRRQRAKQVRFADSLGLELEHVRNFFVEDINIVASNGFHPTTSLKPCIEVNDFTKLKKITDKERQNSTLGSFSRIVKQLLPCFTIPIGDKEYDESKGLVYLNGVVVVQESFSLLGVILVKNLAYIKRVVVRYTLDKWKSSNEVLCLYVRPKIIDPKSDKFSFSLFVNRGLRVGGSLEFVIGYTVQGVSYWDNNQGNNYRFECIGSLTGKEYPCSSPGQTVLLYSADGKPIYSKPNTTVIPGFNRNCPHFFL